MEWTWYTIIGIGATFLGAAGYFAFMLTRGSVKKAKHKIQSEF